MGEIIRGYYPFTYHPVRRLKSIELISIVVLDIEGILRNGFQSIYGMIRMTPSDFRLEILLNVGKDRTKFEIFQSVLKEFQDRVQLKILEFPNSELSVKDINLIVSDSQGSYVLFGILVLNRRMRVGCMSCYSMRNLRESARFVRLFLIRGMNSFIPLYFSEKKDLSALRVTDLRWRKLRFGPENSSKRTFPQFLVTCFWCRERIGIY